MMVFQATSGDVKMNAEIIMFVGSIKPITMGEYFFLCTRSLSHLLTLWWISARLYSWVEADAERLWIWHVSGQSTFNTICMFNTICKNTASIAKRIRFKIFWESNAYCVSHGNYVWQLEKMKQSNYHVNTITTNNKNSYQYITQ